MKIYATSNEWAAQMVRDILLANDIPARVDISVDPYGVTPSAVYIENPDDEPRAREIVTGFDERAGEPTAEARGSWHWRCPQCGEDVEPQFTECWNCRTPKPV